jgi:hypothetical protein
MSRPRTIPFLTAAALAAACSLAALPRVTRSDDVEPVPQNVESAVDRGLAWLAKSQDARGTWEANARLGGATAAATGLAVMAFMARGHTPGQGPYGDTINRAIDAIIAMQQPDGVIAEGHQSEVMYDHGICTMALCEAYGMLDDARQKKARDAISKAIRLILNAQSVHKSGIDVGGWRYTPDTNSSDTSVSGWQLLALRGARNIGANLPKDAIEKGIAFIKHHAAPGGGFTYTGDGNPNDAMTGTGILALSLLGDPDPDLIKPAGDFLLRNFNHLRGEHYYYAAYYCAQAAWQLGGNYWTTINNWITQDPDEGLIHKQAPDGHWPGTEGGDVVCSSMAILALTVPYRYLPIYQR